MELLVLIILALAAVMFLHAVKNRMTTRILVLALIVCAVIRSVLNA